MDVLGEAIVKHSSRAHLSGSNKLEKGWDFISAVEAQGFQGKYHHYLYYAKHLQRTRTI
jgi:hypothetical protein